MTFDLENPINYLTEEDIVNWVKYRKRLYDLLCKTSNYFFEKCEADYSG